MPEAFNAHVLPESRKIPPVEIGVVPIVQNERRDWVSEAAGAVSEQIKNNPVGTGGVAVIGLLALSRKLPMLDEIADAAIGLTKSATKSGSGVPFIKASRGIGGEAAAAEGSVAAEGSTFVSPWARGGLKDAGALDSTANASVVKAQEKAAASLELPPDFAARIAGERLQIPSFTLNGLGNRKLFRPGVLNVANNSSEAHVYLAGRDSTLQIFAKGHGSQGSGFLVDRGLVATANHVVEDAGRSYFVRLANGEKIPAQLVARDPRADVALLKIDKLADLPEPFALANTAVQLPKGRSVFLLGHPKHSEATLMTQGRMFGLERIKNPNLHEAVISAESGKPVLTGIIRHTAEGWKGSSGGPLVLDSGIVAAVHTHGTSQSKFFHRATSSFHVRSLMDDVQRRPMVSGVSNLQTDIRGFRIRPPKPISEGTV